MTHSNGQSSLDQKLEILTEQVGQFTESLTDLEILVERVAATTEKQVAVAEPQASSIDRLTEIVKTLIQNR